jgi:hypothetical protein
MTEVKEAKKVIHLQTMVYNLVAEAAVPHKPVV